MIMDIYLPSMNNSGNSAKLDKRNSYAVAKQPAHHCVFSVVVGRKTMRSVGETKTLF